MPPAYRNPSSKAAPGKTTYLGVRGKDMLFVPPKNKDQAAKSPQGTRMADITDGTSNTAMVVEANDESAVIWTKPDDFEPDPENPLKGLLGTRPEGFLMLLCDGSVQLIRATLDPEMLNRLYTRSDGNPIRLD